MEKFQDQVFWVQGSAEEPYIVEVSRKGGNLTMSCTCAAGIYGRTHCKHRIELLQGKTNSLVEGTFDNLDLLAEMVKGTDVEVRLKEYYRADEAMKSAKTALSAAKKALARAFND